MATYFVDGKSGNDSNNGSSGSPWKTLGKANGQLKPGDEVRVRSATYHESFAIRTPNTTWKADNGHTPIIDGRWHEGLMSGGRMPSPGPGHMPGSNLASMISLSANGLTFEGFTLQNIAGTAITVGASNNITIRNNRIDFVYSNGIRTNAGSSWAEKVVVEGNTVSRTVAIWITDGRGGGGIVIGHGRDCIVRNNLVGPSYGEGIDVHRGSVRTIVEGNIIHTCFSAHLYIQRATDSTLRNNIVYHTGRRDGFMSSRGASAGIIIGDESWAAHYAHSARDTIYNNLVVGTGILFNVPNNEHNYDTQLDKTYIGYNTFIGGPLTQIGVHIRANTKGRTHKNSIFENNIICNMPNGSRIATAEGNLAGVAFRNNLWDTQPPAAARGPGDRIGNPNLVNASAKVTFATPAHFAEVEPRNYQLTSNSTLAIGMASNGQETNGLKPPAIQKDFFGAVRDNSPDIGYHEYAGVTQELTANFSIGPGQLSGPMPHTVDFVDKSVSTSPIVSRLWDFGDGETSTETNPSHTYMRAGLFDVSLTITNDKGQSHTAKQTGLVSVAEQPNILLPDSFRRFALLNAANQQVLAYGTQYPDLRCILVWGGDPFHLLNFDGIDNVQQRYGEDGQAVIMWLDPIDQTEPLMGPEIDTEESGGLRERSQLLSIG